MSNLPFGTYPAPAETKQEEAVAIPAEVTARYWNLIPLTVEARCEPVPGTSRAHLKWMLQELRTMADFGKAMRWLGFIQGTMIAAGYSTVQAERDFTRPFFAHPTPVQKVQESQTVSYAATMSVVRNSGLPVSIVCDLEAMYAALTAALEPSHDRAERQWLNEQDIDK